MEKGAISSKYYFVGYSFLIHQNDFPVYIYYIMNAKNTTQKSTDKLKDILSFVIKITFCCIFHIRDEFFVHIGGRH